MEPVFYIMAIMGCGDGQAMCQPARLEPTQYTSIQQCRAQAPAALARNTDLSYPVITADCRASGPVMAGRAKAATRG